jgi:hypothetical protein
MSSAYRAFISYSHLDRKAVAVVAEALREVGLMAWSDHDLAAGQGFTEQIQANIAHSHVFIPMLTRRSHRRGWVHQEIGYAVAVKVPCVPLCIGKLPEGMISMAHAVTVDEELSNLTQVLRRVNFGQLVRESEWQRVPPIACVLEPEERAEMIEGQSAEAFSKLGPCTVRVQGGLTSFSIPDELPGHPAWAARYGNKPRSPHAYRWFRRERIALERHAIGGGVRMIIDHGLDVDRFYGRGVKRARLAILVKFLESIPEEVEATVALVKNHPPDLLLSVGDWFVAESLAGQPVRGVIQTVFTAHAPTVSRMLAEFDQKLDALVAKQGSPPGRSREWAIHKLRAMMRKLPGHPMWDGE